MKGAALFVAVLLLAGTSFGGRTFEGAQARGLLTESGLHVTPEGLIALAYESLNRLKEQKLIAADSRWETDPAVVLQRLVDAKKAAMEKK